MIHTHAYKLDGIQHSMFYDSLSYISKLGLGGAIVRRLCIQTSWFGCTKMMRLTILTDCLVRTQETIQISLSEDTFMILSGFFVRTQKTIQISLSDDTIMTLILFLVRTWETVQISLSEDTFMTLTEFLVKTQETVQISLSEDTFMILARFLVRSLKTIQISLGADTVMILTVFFFVRTQQTIQISLIIRGQKGTRKWVVEVLSFTCGAFGGTLLSIVYCVCSLLSTA